jgi:hypothetical protein
VAHEVTPDRYRVGARVRVRVKVRVRVRVQGWDHGGYVG